MRRREIRNCYHDDKPDLPKNGETFTTERFERTRDFEIKLPLLAVTRKARSAPIAMIKPPPPFLSGGAWKNEIREDVSYCLITPGPVKAGFWTEEGHEQISGGHVQTKQRGASDSGAA